MPGLGKVRLSGSELTIDPPRGDCGMSHCSSLKRTTAYSTSWDGEVVTFDFSPTTYLTGVRDGYVAELLENEPQPNQLGSKSFRRIDACTYISTDDESKIMASLAPSCPAPEIREGREIRRMRLILRGPNDREKGITSPDGRKLADTHGVFTDIPGEAAVAMISGSEDLEIPLGVPVEVQVRVPTQPVHHQYSQYVKYFRILGIVHNGRVLRRYEGAHKGRIDGGFEIEQNSYPHGSPKLAVEADGPAWRSFNCERVAVLGYMPPRLNREEPKVVAVRRLAPQAFSDCADPYTNPNRHLGRRVNDAQWWHIAQDAGQMVLADRANVRSFGTVVQLPVLAGSMDPGGTALLRTVQVECGRHLGWSTSHSEGVDRRNNEAAPEAVDHSSLPSSMAEAVKNVACTAPWSWGNQIGRRRDDSGTMPFPMKMSPQAFLEEYRRRTARGEAPRPLEVMLSSLWEQRPAAQEPWFAVR